MPPDGAGGAHWSWSRVSERTLFEASTSSRLRENLRLEQVE